MKTTAPATSHIITSENVESESYYNCVQIARHTSYADPIAAARGGKKFRVKKDENGNVFFAEETK